MLGVSSGLLGRRSFSKKASKFSINASLALVSPSAIKLSAPASKVDKQRARGCFRKSPNREFSVGLNRSRLSLSNQGFRHHKVLDCFQFPSKSTIPFSRTRGNVFPLRSRISNGPLTGLLFSESFWVPRYKTAHSAGFGGVLPSACPRERQERPTRCTAESPNDSVKIRAEPLGFFASRGCWSTKIFKRLETDWRPSQIQRDSAFQQSRQLACSGVFGVTILRIPAGE
jgi:hypothetical protein